MLKMNEIRLENDIKAENFYLVHERTFVRQYKKAIGMEISTFYKYFNKLQNYYELIRAVIGCNICRRSKFISIA